MEENKEEFIEILCKKCNRKIEPQEQFIRMIEYARRGYVMNIKNFHYNCYIHSIDNGKLAELHKKAEEIMFLAKQKIGDLNVNDK